MVKYIKNSKYIENTDFLVIALYIIYTIIHQLNYEWKESNDIISYVIIQRIWHKLKQIVPKVWNKPYLKCIKSQQENGIYILK